MSFIDTIALPLFLAIIGLIALVFVCGFVYTSVAQARANMLARKRDLAQEKKAYEFIEEVFTEVACNDDLKDALPAPLQEKMWELHFKFSQTKELSR